MTTTFAYDHGLPCKNPNCKSHGRPHPNCKCYGYSEGGEVVDYCSESRHHKPWCEYYQKLSDGGDVLPKFEDTQDPLPAFKDTQEQLPAFEDTTDQPALPSFEDTQEVPTPQVARETPSFSSPLLDQSQVATLEGLSHGILGKDLTKSIEVKTGLSTLPEIEAREKQFPFTEGATGAVGRALPFLIPLEGIGANVLRNAAVAFGYAGSDAIGKSILNEDGGDPVSAVASTFLAHGGMDFLTYSLTDGLFKAADMGLKGAKNLATVENAKKALVWLSSKPINTAAEVGAGIYGYEHGMSLKDLGLASGFVAKWVDPILERIIGKQLTKYNKYVSDGIVNCLMNNKTLSVPAIVNYTQRIAEGTRNILPAMEGLFKGGAEELTEPVKEGVRNQINGWMEKGGVNGGVSNPQEPMFKYAKGGEVGRQSAPDHFAEMYPKENILLNETKARVSNYLNSLRPSVNHTKLPFDSDAPQSQKKRSYEQAIELAANPIGILNHVNKGTLTPELMVHFKSMFPGAHGLLSEKMTKRITEAQLKDEKPPFHKRQAMSLFLGTDLDSTFTPQAIQALQNVYIQKQIQQQQQQPPTKAKKSTAPLSKISNSYLTDEQSRIRREQNQKA